MIYVLVQVGHALLGRRVNNSPANKKSFEDSKNDSQSADILYKLYMAINSSDKTYYISIIRIAFSAYDLVNASVVLIMRIIQPALLSSMHKPRSVSYINHCVREEILSVYQALSIARAVTSKTT